MDKITETIVLEVTGVDQRSYYPNGYNKPAQILTMIRLTHNAEGGDGLRAATINIPGNLPLGTRFKVAIEQIDDVSAATIHRGALPVIEDAKLLAGEGEIQ